MLKMMSRFLILLFLLAGLAVSAQTGINQTDASGKKQGLWQKKQENGKLLYEGTFKDDQPVGEFKRYHPNGAIKAIINYTENSDSSYAKMYDQKGKQIAEGAYLNQQKNGKWSYYESGRLISEETYKLGLKDGKSKSYYPTGELFEESDWVNNQQTGVYRAYFKSGKPYFECRMNQGQRNGFCHIYQQNGILEVEASYQNGLRQNEWKYYDEHGNLSYTLVYDLGIVMNPEVLDSIQQIQFKEMDENRKKLADPEKFMDNPMEYMRQSMSPR